MIRDNILEVEAVMRAAGIPHDFVVVDDGSRDGTFDVLEQLTALLPNLTVLQLSRNFGKEAALAAGLEVALGDAVVTMDADLQHPPELIPEMVRLWRDEGFEVVEGVKTHRGREHPLNTLFARLFYRSFSAMSGIDLRDATDFKLLDRRAIQAWHAMGETITFFRGMTRWVGFRHVEVPFAVRDRAADGRSRWRFARLVSYGVDSIASYTSHPLYFVAYIGTAFCIGAVGLATQTLWVKLSGHAVSGFTTVIILLLAIGGFVMIDLGIIGIYLSKIYEESKRRPRFIISRRLGGDGQH